MGQSVCAVVRPEAIAPIADEPVAPATPRRVLDIAYLGDRISCVVEADGGAS